MTTTNPILVWPFDEAPQEYRDLSDHGGDEDGLALVPVEHAGKWIPWLEEGRAFGRCSVSKHALPDGSAVYIGAHA